MNELCNFTLVWIVSPGYCLGVSGIANRFPDKINTSKRDSLKWPMTSSGKLFEAFQFLGYCKWEHYEYDRHEGKAGFAF